MLLKKLVIAVALVAGIATAASAQTYYHTQSPFQSYVPQPRYNAPAYTPQQFDQQQYEQFNPRAQQPTFGSLPAYRNYCMGLGGRLTPWH